MIVHTIDVTYLRYQLQIEAQEIIFHFSLAYKTLYRI